MVYILFLKEKYQKNFYGKTPFCQVWTGRPIQRPAGRYIPAGVVFPMFQRPRFLRKNTAKRTAVTTTTAATRA